MNDLTVRGENKMVSNEIWNTLYKQAGEIIKSGFLPASIKTPAQAIAVILTARELGIGMMEGFRSIHIIDNRPSISPQLMLSLIYNSNVAENIKIESADTYCIVSGNRKGQPVITIKFTEEDAKNLNLLWKDNWKKQKKNMLRWRAISAWARLVCPDVIGGLYTPEEIENNVDEIGEAQSAIEMTEKVASSQENYDKFYEETATQIMEEIESCEDEQVLHSIKKKYQKEIEAFINEDRIFILDQFDSRLQNIISNTPVENATISNKTGSIGGDSEKEGVPPDEKEKPLKTQIKRENGDFTALEKAKKFGDEWLPQAIKEIDARNSNAQLMLWKRENKVNFDRLLEEHKTYILAYLNNKISKKINY